MRLETFEQARELFAEIFTESHLPAEYGMENDEYYWVPSELKEYRGYTTGPGIIFRRSDGEIMWASVVEVGDWLRTMHPVGDWSKELKQFPV